MTIAPLLCALLVASHAPAGGLASSYARTRVRGHDEAAEAASGSARPSSPRTRWASPCTYGETASDRAKQYNGRVYDPGTGFHDYGARMYWPEIGRFVSADTYAGDIRNPASLNRYSYVHNNPYKYIDPTGHYSVVPSIYGPEGGPLQWGAGWLATKMAAVSLDESQNMAVRAGAAVLGTVASLFDAETTEKTGAVMGMAGSIKINAATGKTFEAKIAGKMEAEGWNVAREVTLETPGGARTRMDIVGTRGDSVRCVECKSSATAPLTPAQEAAHPQIGGQGATVKGAGKPGVPGGTQIPPTKVEIIRPQ